MGKVPKLPELLIKGGITYKTEEEIFNFLSDHGVSPHLIRITSFGGNAYAALQSYEWLKVYKGKTIIHIEGVAASGGAVIAMSGNHVIITEHSTLMIHNPRIGAMENATSAELRREADELDAIAVKTRLTIHRKTGISDADIKELMDNETSFTAQEARALGFADEIFNPPKGLTFMVRGKSPTMNPVKKRLLLAAKKALEDELAAVMAEKDTHRATGVPPELSEREAKLKERLFFFPKFEV